MSLNIIKRVSAVVMCIIITMLCTTICYAEEGYTISELDDMVINLPNNMIAATRSTPNTDKYFSVFGLDYNTNLSTFKNSDIYLQGMDTSSKLTVTVTMTQTSESKGITNYNLLNSDKLAEVQNNFVNQEEYISCTPDEAGKLVWLRFNVNVQNKGATVKAYQANTVYDGMSINITVQRNDGNVTSDDYKVFSDIVNSTFFKTESKSSAIMPFVIGGVGVLIVAMIVVLIIVIKKAKKRKKKNANDKIIDELASKYSKRSNIDKKDDAMDKTSDFYSQTTVYDEDDEDVFDKTQYSIDSEGEVLIYKKPDTDEIDKQVEKVSEDTFAEDIEDTTVKVYKEINQTQDSDMQQEQADEEEPSVNETTEQSVEEFDNDEILLREQVKKAKFNDSDDFFEEAPNKTVGVISNKDIENAEDYDVINEVEEKISKVEKSNDDEKGKDVLEIVQNIGAGIKNFFVHCGYFCTNVSRMIKRKRNISKRKKEEEERKRRAKIRAERLKEQKRQMENGRLVQVNRSPKNSSRSQNVAHKRPPRK